MLNAIIEAVPVILAIISVFFILKKLRERRGAGNNSQLYLALVASLLLIIAQTSWQTLVTMGRIEDTTWANQIWTLFNSLVMISYIIRYRPDTDNK